MWAICIKEIRQFFSALSGIVAIVVFLLLCGLMLFIFPDTNIIDFGYATLSQFFELAPWLLLLIVPAITMRSFAEEFKMGTYEILQTKPLTTNQIILGKYLGCFCISLCAILPTLIYIFSIQSLSAAGGIDVGATIGSYIGLVFLAATFVAISLYASSLTNNGVIAFIISAFGCFILYNGFNAISRLPVLKAGADYYVAMLGIDFHYQNISRGVLDSRDVIYFVSVIAFFLFITKRKMNGK